MSLSNNTTVQFSLSLDGLSQIDSDSIVVNGNNLTGAYLNSQTNTSTVNTSIGLASGGQFNINSSNALSLFNVSNTTGITTLSRGQQSIAPSLGSDLTNKTYVDSIGANAIQKIGTTTGLNGNAVLSSVSGSSFSFSDGSGNNLVVFSQQHSTFYTSGGQFIIMNNSVLGTPYFICNESDNTQYLYHPQTYWAATDAVDVPNKAYVDAAITSSTLDLMSRLGAVGINGIFQLLASGSALFKNSSGTNLLTLSGSGCGINNPVITNTASFPTLYASGGASHMLALDGSGNLVSTPNIGYISGLPKSTFILSIPTGIGIQQMTLEWIHNPTTSYGWQLSANLINKFPESDVPINIPNLYSSTLNITNTNTNYLTLKNTSYSVGDYINLTFNHGISNYSANIQSFLSGGNDVQLRFLVTNNTTLVSSWFMSSNISSNISNLTSFANYFKINDATNNSISTDSTGLNISTTAIRPNAPISYPVSSGNVSLSVPRTGNSPQPGDRLVLWPGDSGNYAYALGMNGGTMWYNVPSGSIHNFYVNGVSTLQINSSGIYLPNTSNQTTFPQSIVIGNSSNSLQFGQMSTYQFTNTSVAWTGGYTVGNFTKNSSSSYVTVTGGVTCYTGTVAMISVSIRLYNSSNGVYYYFTQNQVFNIVTSHTFIPTNNTFTSLPNGVYTVYIYGGGTGVTSDINDYVNMTFRVSPS